MSTWSIAPAPPKSFFSQFPDLPEIVARLLYHRGITTQGAIDEFLNPNYEENTHDPALFQDMEKAVNRLLQAVDANESIIIHGDYDADGVSAAAILQEALAVIGARVSVFLPHRETEGYGLNMKTVELLHHDGAAVIVTCDCGISNADEVARAQELGMDVIITDHHNLPDALPPAFAIIHPKREGETYPFLDLSGGGVAFKLASALLRSRDFSKYIDDVESFLKWRLDCVAISTVADMVPLLGENRTLVKFGLVVLDQTKRLGLQALYGRARVRHPVDARTIGFQIAPRLNAAGRMEHANTAYALLTTTDEAEAERLADALETSNKERQDATASVVAQARAQVSETLSSGDMVIIAHNASWSPSLVGLAASRLVNEYHRPAFVLTKRADAWMGSGRSIPAFHLIDQMRAMEPSPFFKLGGHPGAAGFTLAKGVTPADFAARMRELTKAVLKAEDCTGELSIDAEISLAGMTWESYEILQQFAPFGVENPEPTYLIRNCTVVERAEMGKLNQHLRLGITQEGSEKKWKALAFSKAVPFRDVQVGDHIDIVCSVEVDEWNGNRQLMLTIADVKKL
jgi:single-stranded-DNA-specific exonuclease